MQRILSINVLMSHQADQKAIEAVPECVATKLILILFPFPTHSMTICSH